ncbi:hypothetical protein PFLUV_G00199420 [Perca fluviatilis]|uniref:Uncharacterized protein n=1 Tax=Perca fluviatilis TaxID=8168 RepID=A0A6A5DTS6_PERFL|nr:hypothetical protein PFLUV_G00199420 [Perca fluviatilis]
MDEVWRKLSGILKDREPASQPSREEMEPLPPKKKMALLLMVSQSESEPTVQRQNLRQARAHTKTMLANALHRSP